MSTDLTRREQLVSSLEEKEYREAFVADQVRIGLPLQIKQMRDEREWSQEKLGAEMVPPMVQESVWRLENPNKANLTIGTLLRVAARFDVALMVRFVPFSQLIDSTPWLTGGNRSVPEYTKDEGLKNPHRRFADALGELQSDRARTTTGKLIDASNLFQLDDYAPAA